MMRSHESDSHSQSVWVALDWSGFELQPAVAEFKN